MIDFANEQMRETVAAAIGYTKTGYGRDALRERFNELCASWDINEHHASPKDRRLLLAQRVVIESLSELTSEQARRLDKVMDEIVNGPTYTFSFVSEEPVGALCYLPKSIHILASNEAKKQNKTAKRFFYEMVLAGMQGIGVITRAQLLEALKLPADYGWKGRNK